jgi:hypothetical protein
VVRGWDTGWADGRCMCCVEASKRDDRYQSPSSTRKLLDRQLFAMTVFTAFVKFAQRKHSNFA